MALTPASLTIAAKNKAELARARVLRAKEDLDAANHALADALPQQDMPMIEGAARRTMHAELEVQQAADELQAVNLLLEQELAQEMKRADTARKPGSRSGTGAESLVPHLGRKNGD